MSIGKTIKELRKAAGLSQGDVAGKLGMARATYATLETGRREPDLGELKAISKLYEISMMELVAEEGDDWPGVISEPTPTYGIHPDENKQPQYIPKIDSQKFSKVLLYITSQIGARAEVGESTLYKLLYFIDFDYYERHEESLTGLSYIRTAHGPVPTKSFDDSVAQMIAEGEMEIVSTKYFKNTQRKYLPVVTPSLGDLTAREVKHIDRELAWRGDTSLNELQVMIQHDPPWRVAREGDALPYHAVTYRKNTGIY